MATALTALTACVIGCGSTGPAPAPQAPPPPAPAPEPTPAASELDERERLLEATLARARAIQAEVASVRSLAFKRPVPAERQTKEEFAEVVARELEKELPAAESKKLSAGLFHLGFLAEEADIAEEAARAATSQVAAYYNPDTGRFYAVTLSSDQTWLDMMTAHELTHGLQDQHFDLRGYYGSGTAAKLSEDQVNARRFVVEGEASFVMLLHMIAAKGDGALADGQLLTVRLMVAMMAATPWQDLLANPGGASGPVDAETEAQVEAMKSIPAIILTPMFESYTRGAYAVMEVHRAGGWEAVSDLYANPPDTTEQVLHPVEKLVTKRDHPSTITLPSWSARFGEPLLDETLGELGWRVYFETWQLTDAADDAAAGWDGDRVVVYQTPAGPIGIAVLTFDSTRDAVEFESAFQESLIRRFGAGKTSERGGVFRHRRPSGADILVTRRGANLWVVDGARGANARSLLDDLTRATGIARR